MMEHDGCAESSRYVKIEHDIEARRKILQWNTSFTVLEENLMKSVGNHGERIIEFS